MNLLNKNSCKMLIGINKNIKLIVKVMKKMEEKLINLINNIYKQLFKKIVDNYKMKNKKIS